MLQVPDIKQAIVALLSEHLPSDVRVLYAPPADVKGRYCVLSDAVTDAEPAFVRADATLLRYDLTYRVDVECHSGPDIRTPLLAEQQAYLLADEVLTILVRGNATGNSLLAVRLPEVSQVEWEGDHVLTTWAMTDNHDVAVAVKLAIGVRRR